MPSAPARLAGGDVEAMAGGGQSLWTTKQAVDQQDNKSLAGPVWLRG